MKEKNAELTVSRQDDTSVLRFKGRLDAPGVAAIWKKATVSIRQIPSAPVQFDMSDVVFFDTAGAALLLHLENLLSNRQSVAYLNFDTNFEKTLNLFRKNFIPRDSRIFKRPRRGMVVFAGQTFSDFLNEIAGMIRFTGEVSVAFFLSIRKPWHIRWKEFIRVFEKAGVDALFIVALISFIVGLVVAFQAAMPMRMFGAEIYVANLIGLAVTRELGPLMTAVVLAGRSGSAFAAETGTMKINEELDALLTIGIDPVHFLVLPRVLAAAFVTPLLTVFADIIGIAGGFTVLFLMGHPVQAFLTQVVEQVSFTDVAGGILKATVFGVLIAATGCYRGFQTESGPGGVGVSTTRSVVTSIVIIAVADALFSIVFYVIGI